MFFLLLMAQFQILTAEIAALKRFWKDVGIENRGESYTVTLDKRPLKTPSGNSLLLPSNKSLVASLIAVEWDSQEKIIKPHALTMVKNID